MSTLRLGMAALALVCSAGLATAQTAAPADDAKTAPTMTKPADDAKTAPTMTKETDQKPPIAGANSFTEEQARERIAKAGFEDVAGLKKDDQGIWRGQAKKSGAQVSVALDYRGNVVQQ